MNPLEKACTMVSQEEAQRSPFPQPVDQTADERPGEAWLHRQTSGTEKEARRTGTERTSEGEVTARSASTSCTRWHLPGWEDGLFSQTISFDDIRHYRVNTEGD